MSLALTVVLAALVGVAIGPWGVLGVAFLSQLRS